MAFATTDLIPILPELVTLVTACTILLVDLFLKEEDKGINHTPRHPRAAWPPLAPPGWSVAASDRSSLTAVSFATG